MIFFNNLLRKALAKGRIDVFGYRRINSYLDYCANPGSISFNKT